MTANENNIEQYFKERAETYDSGNWASDQRLIAQHVNLTRYIPGWLCLDAGCGTGLVGEAFANKGCSVVGIDISPHMISYAKGRLQWTILGNVLLQPFDDSTFDLIICRQVIHYVNPQITVKEFRRVLKPTGRLLISSIIPYSSIDFNWFRIRTKIKKPLQKWIPTYNSIHHLLKNASFNVLDEIKTTTRSLLSKTMSRTEHEHNIKTNLISHYCSASEDIKSQYNMAFSNNDISYNLCWLLAIASPAQNNGLNKEAE